MLEVTKKMCNFAACLDVDDKRNAEFQPSVDCRDGQSIKEKRTADGSFTREIQSIP